MNAAASTSPHVDVTVQSVLGAARNVVRAANKLPADGDDYDYFASFPAFKGSMRTEGRRILKTIQTLFRHQQVRADWAGGNAAVELMEKSEQVIEANDAGLERAAQHMDTAEGLRKEHDDLKLSTYVTAKRYTSLNTPSSAASSMPHVSSISKPQWAFEPGTIDNGPGKFRPLLRSKPNAITPLTIDYQNCPEPDRDFPHPYQPEIKQWEPPEKFCQLVDSPKLPSELDETPFLMVEDKSSLDVMMKELRSKPEFAFDLEHHSMRSYLGLTCLIQISTVEKDYIVDAIALRSHLGALNELFTDGSILKIAHGSQHDVIWLQRDFGIYVVGLFDTGVAARHMNFSECSLKYLVRHYCDVHLDKEHRLADWRIRPLKLDLIKYARSDTHYLIYISHRMRNDLLNTQGFHELRQKKLTHVYNNCKDLCLSRFIKPVLTDKSYLGINAVNRKQLNSRQLAVLQALYKWRDDTARQHDESAFYVLPNHMLLQIAEMLPREPAGVLACCNPIPPLVRRCVRDVHALVMQASVGGASDGAAVLDVSAKPDSSHSTHDLSTPTLRSKSVRRDSSSDDDTEPLPPAATFSKDSFVESKDGRLFSSFLSSFTSRWKTPTRKIHKVASLDGKWSDFLPASVSLGQVLPSREGVPPPRSNGLRLDKRGASLEKRVWRLADVTPLVEDDANEDETEVIAQPEDSDGEGNVANFVDLSATRKSLKQLARAEKRAKKNDLF